MNAIETRGLTKRFKTRTALAPLSLCVEQGELFALLGLNGAGKTTCIKMLCGLLPPTQGDALLLGESILRHPTAAKQLLNISPQETAVAPGLTVQENLALIARLYGATRAQAARDAQQMLERLQLADRARDKAKSLSGGLGRRLSIAMALISNPRILFLDEPTLGLDVRSRRDLWKLLLGLKGSVTMLLTTHYLEEAQALADRIGVLHNGKLCALGSPAQLMQQTHTATLEEAFLALTDEEDCA